MISTLVEMLGRFYANNDLANVEVLARNIHAAVPCDQVSLLFLGLAYYKTGRSNEALNTFDKVSATRESKTDHSLKKDEKPVFNMDITKYCPDVWKLKRNADILWAMTKSAKNCTTNRIISAKSLDIKSG